MDASAVGFLVRFSEFAGTPLTQIEAVLEDVSARVSETFGSRRTEVIYYETADTLASRTKGRNARRTKDTPGGTTVYSEKLRTLYEAHALAHRVPTRRRRRR